MADALGATLTRERAGVSEVTTAPLFSALAAAVAGGWSPVVPAAGDHLAALSAVAPASGVYTAANPWVRVDVVARGRVPALIAALFALPLPPPAAAAAASTAAAARRAGGGGGRPLRRHPWH